MKKTLITILTLSLTLSLSAKAEQSFMDTTEYTGDVFFEPAVMYPTQSGHSHGQETNKTIPPIKLLRMKLQNRSEKKTENSMEYAPVAPKPSIYNSETSTSEYASKEVKDDFEEMAPDGFEADDETVAEKGSKKLFSSKNAKSEDMDDDKEDIILDCDNVDYDTINYLIKATDNVNIEFVKQKTVVKADMLTFDRINNTIKAEGNVRILKNGHTVTGDYIFVDLNEENALIENPLSSTDSIRISSKKGYVYGDRLVQEEGKIEVTEDYPINFRSGRRGPITEMMLTPKKDKFSEDLGNGIIKMRADSIKIKQKGDLEVLAIKRGVVSKGDHTILKIPAIKVYTNKNHDYAETNFWEVGYYRGLGLFTGPGWVFELPKGSVLKAIPFINYYRGVGVGGMGRFHSGTNETTAAYGTASKRFFVSGRQELDDDLFLHYSVNSYMDEWFLGRRRPKYGAAIVYKKDYASNGFLIPGQNSGFSHRIEAGYFHDLDFDSHYEKIPSSGNMGTTRFRYMAEARQSLFNYSNPEKMTAFSLNVVSQLSAALYGTGDTQVIGKIGPNAHMQYKRWMQDIGYSFNAYEDHTPMARYDAFRYGSQYLYLREYLRICKWLTVSWFGNINTTNDSINHKRMQENTFYISVGPEDFKLHLGYDFARETFRAVLEVMMNAKGANVEYNTFEIKQDKKAKKESNPVAAKTDENLAPTQPRVLQRAVVEDIKVMDDVL